MKKRRNEEFESAVSLKDVVKAAHIIRVLTLDADTDNIEEGKISRATKLHHRKMRDDQTLNEYASWFQEIFRQ